MGDFVSGMLADLMATVQGSGRVENQGVSGFPLQSDSSQAPLPAGLPVSFTPLQGGLHERQTTTQSHQPCEAATLQGGVVGNGQGSGAATLSGGVGSSLFGASTSHVPFPQINQRPNPPVTPADPAHRSVGPRQLPVVQDSAFQTIARSIEQLQEIQKEALKSAAPAHVPSGGSSPSQVEQLKPGTSELPQLPQGSGKRCLCCLGSGFRCRAVSWRMFRRRLQNGGWQCVSLLVRLIDNGCKQIP